MKAIVVGAGPSGVSAALYLESRGVEVTLFEKDEVGGLIKNVSKVSHFVGVELDETGKSFSEKLLKQVSNTSIKLIYEEVIEIKKEDNFKVKTDKGCYESDVLIYAAGSSPKELKFKNTSIKKDKSDIKDYTPHTAIVVGGGDGACKEAIYLSQFFKAVHVIEHRKGMNAVEEFKKKIIESDNIYFHDTSELIDIESDPAKKVVIYNSTSDENITINDEEIYIYVYIGQEPNSNLLKDLLPLADGYIDSEVETNVKGLYVVGDVRKKSIRQIATATSDGCEAAIKAYKNN